MLNILPDIPVQSNTAFIMYLPGIIVRTVYLIRNPPRVIEWSVLKTTDIRLLEDNTSAGVWWPHAMRSCSPVTSFMTVTLSREQCWSNWTSICTKCRSTRCNHNQHVRSATPKTIEEEQQEVSRIDTMPYRAQIQGGKWTWTPSAYQNYNRLPDKNACIIILFQIVVNNVFVLELIDVLFVHNPFLSSKCHFMIVSIELLITQLFIICTIQTTSSKRMSIFSHITYVFINNVCLF